MSTLSISDARDYLNITSPANDTELQAVIDAAEATIVGRVGPLTASSVTRRVSGGGQSIVLPVLPAISLTSVTYVGSTALTLSDLYLDTTSGVVSYAFAGMWFYPGWYDVVYQAGRATVPADLLQALKELVRHVWTTQRGSGVQRPGAMSSEALSITLPGAAYTLPIRVEQLLIPYQRFGFA